MKENLTLADEDFTVAAVEEEKRRHDVVSMCVLFMHDFSWLTNISL